MARPEGHSVILPRVARTHPRDPTASHAHGILQACLAREILILADRAYPGAGATVRTRTATTASSHRTISASTAYTPAFGFRADAPSPA